MDLLPWNLDLISQKEIRTEGLFAALNDCLYRNMKTVQYLIMMDLDELIIPYQVASSELTKEKWSDGVVAGSDIFLSQSIIIRIRSETVLKAGGGGELFLRYVGPLAVPFHAEIFPCRAPASPTCWLT